MKSLESHEGVVAERAKRVFEEMATPLSNIDPEHITNMIVEIKETLKDCDADLRDARRRINATKEPNKKNKNKKEVEPNPDSDSDGVGSECP